MRRRIVDVTMFWAPESGGVRRYLLAKHAELRGHPAWDQVIVAPVADEHCIRVPAVPLPFSNGYRFPLDRRAAADTIARLAPTIIEAGDPYLLAWSSLDAGERCGAPVVAFCHSDLVTLATSTLGEWARASTERYVRRLYSRCASVLAPSVAMANRLTALGLSNVSVHPLGVDADLFSPARRSDAWRASLGIEPDRRVLLYAGRFGPEKHLQLIADAVDGLGPRYVFVAIGSGPAAPAGKRVVVLPFERDPLHLARALASCDAFVHAGDQETFGLAALEALACGTPVIARASSGLAEIVDDSVGASVRRGTSTGFATAIDELFTRDRAALGHTARARAAGHDWSVVIGHLLGHYETLLGARARSAASRDAALA